ncbi:hypothetical protein MMC08_003029 [Hypocenomyce scalaris]|nr:hypothetical protein [Hypocenomyce scalaris]
MADLDAELLALAGGDSSDEESTKPTTTTTKNESPASSARSPTVNLNGATMGKLGMAQKKSAASKARVGTKKPTKKGRRDESQEEGEASSVPGSPNSLQSAPMSESDSDTSPAADVDDDGHLFPYERQFYSEKDKAEIMAMSEVQRESILAERAQLQERKLQDLHLRRLLQAREIAESRAADRKKRKAGAADLEDTQRKSSRQKTTLGGRKVGESSDAMEAYKRQREQKGLRDEQRRREGEERRERKARGAIDDGYSDADADGESEVEWDDGKPKAGRRSVSLPRDELPADLKDFEHIRVGRDNFAKVCFYPGFENAIKNCFARISIGVDKTTGENVYRVAQIKTFTEGKPYAMEGPNGKPFVTNQYALVAVGKSEKEWPFLACSNSKFTEAEYERYKKTMIVENLSMPTKPSLISKINDINNLINHRFTDEEIQQKLNRSGALKTKFASLERSTILNRRKDAEARGEEKTIAKLDAELAALEGPKLAFGTSLTKSPAKPSSITTSSSQQERLAALNRANRKANAEEIRKAQHAEKKAEAIARKAVERGEAVANPFARVKTRAKVHYDVNGDTLAPPLPANHAMEDLFEGNSRDASRAGTPLSMAGSKTGTPKRSGTPLLVKQNNEDKKGGLIVMRKRNMDDDVIAAMDMGIDLEI